MAKQNQTADKVRRAALCSRCSLEMIITVMMVMKMDGSIDTKCFTLVDRKNGLPAGFLLLTPLSKLIKTPLIHYNPSVIH